MGAKKDDDDKFAPHDELLSEDINQYYGYGKGYTTNHEPTKFEDASVQSKTEYPELHYIMSVILLKGETPQDAIERGYSIVKKKPKIWDVVYVVGCSTPKTGIPYVYTGIWKELDVRGVTWHDVQNLILEKDGCCKSSIIIDKEETNGSKEG